MNKNNMLQKKKNLKNNFSNLYADFIENGLSLGHNSLKLQKSWHSNLSKCFLGARNKTIIFNYNLTLNYLIRALYVFTTLAKSNGDILIVNTNPELSKLIYHIKKNTKSCHLFFSDCGWTKGTLTNWSQLSNKIKTFVSFYHNFDTFLNQNNIYFPNYKKMKKSYKGFIYKPNKLKANNDRYDKDEASNKKDLPLNNFSSKFFGKQPQKIAVIENYFKKSDNSNLHSKWKPDMIILISINDTESIIKEANSLNIPTIAFLDSNSNVPNITYPIPTNTYYYSFIWLFSTLITKLSNKYFN